MKRFSIALALLVMSVLAACSPVNRQSAALAGDWEGELLLGGNTVPVVFTVNSHGEVEDHTFHVAFSGDDFSYRVGMQVSGSQVGIDARASLHDVGNIRFELAGIIEGDLITGRFIFEGEWYYGDEGPFHHQGTFTIVRTAR